MFIEIDHSGDGYSIDDLKINRHINTDKIVSVEIVCVPKIDSNNNRYFLYWVKFSMSNNEYCHKTFDNLNSAEIYLCDLIKKLNK